MLRQDKYFLVWSLFTLAWMTPIICTVEDEKVALTTFFGGIIILCIKYKITRIEFE